jgi:hypothetical protein
LGCWKIGLLKNLTARHILLDLLGLDAAANPSGQTVEAVRFLLI